MLWRRQENRWNILLRLKSVNEVNRWIMRIFNTYGQNMRFDDGRVVTNFISQALKNEKITLIGKGKQTRSFCYVDDLIKWMILLMDSNYQKLINIENPN